MTKYRQTGHIEVHRSRRTDEVCGIVKPASASPPRAAARADRRKPVRLVRRAAAGPFFSPSGGFGRARPSFPSEAARRRGQRSTAAELEGPRIRHGASRIRWWGSRGVRVVVGASAGDAGGVGAAAVWGAARAARSQVCGIGGGWAAAWGCGGGCRGVGADLPPRVPHRGLGRRGGIAPSGGDGARAGAQAVRTADVLQWSGGEERSCL